jgi:hypothetical protein
MEQRRPRLGDIVDDYCPRERRLANHVVVAMIGDAVRQTRCTTCDAEHPYKQAKVPPRRKKAETPAALVKQVAEGLAEKPRLNGDAAVAPEVVPPSPPLDRPSPPPSQAAASVEAASPQGEVEGQPADREEDGPVHRQLIRATLPRLPGEEREPRPIPEFTMREVRSARGFRHGRPRAGQPANRGPNGRAGAQDFRFGTTGPWSGNQRQRGGQPQHHGGRPRPHGQKKPR